VATVIKIEDLIITAKIGKRGSVQGETPRIAILNKLKCHLFSFTKSEDR
jgi:hypothetical protein